MMFAKLEDAAAFFESNAQHCLALWIEARWPHGIHCPRCYTKQVFRFTLPSDGSHIKCPVCGYSFNSFTGSILPSMKLSLPHCLTLMWNAVQKKPRSVHGLVKVLLVSTDTIRHANSLVKEVKNKVQRSWSRKHCHKFFALMDACSTYYVPPLGRAATESEFEFPCATSWN
jgi:transposase-like protein